MLITIKFICPTPKVAAIALIEAVQVTKQVLLPVVYFIAFARKTKLGLGQQVGVKFVAIVIVVSVYLFHIF